MMSVREGFMRTKLEAAKQQDDEEEKERKKLMFE